MSSVQRMVWGTAGWLGILLAGSFPAPSARAEDWPAYAHDAARTNVSTEKLRLPLALEWSFQPRFAPQPAWADPKAVPIEGMQELRRVHFDDALQTVAAGGRVFFGSSSENKLYCLDAASGRIVWTKITGGPIRLAPTVWEDKVYVGSDDGWAWCLNAADGAEIWKFHAAPEDRRVLGHGRLISLWPLRTGILIDGGVAYFGAGIFPAEGVFLYALDAASGRLLWKNDSCGETPQSRFSPQGYLLASDSTLYVPMGRVSPAAFDRQTGALQGTTSFGKTVGGTYALLADNQVFTGTEEIIGYNPANARDRFAVLGGHRLVVAGPRAYAATGKRLMAFDREGYPPVARKVHSLRTKRDASEKSITSLKRERGVLVRENAELEADLKGLDSPAAGESKLAEQRQKLAAQLKANQKHMASLDAQSKKEKAALDELQAQIDPAEAELAKQLHWDVECTCDQALVLAGDLLLAGGSGQVLGVDAASGQTLWNAPIQGQAKGLAVADRHVLVSSDQGPLYCFGSAHGAGTVVSPPLTPTPFDDAAQAALFRQAAQQALRRSDCRRGFALVLGCRTGALALELARQSELMVYAVCDDDQSLAAARRAIDAAGMYGGRVCVERWPATAVPYADYFANLVLSESSLLGGPGPELSEALRMLKPLGGTLLVGFPQPAAAAACREQLPAEATLLSDEGRTWVKFVRGALPGAGSWTHLYGNPANTACGDDEAVRAPLGVLWFGQPGPGKMLSRHARAAGPLSADGRLFCEGENCLMAYDAYNGLKLWEREIPGAIRPTASHDGSNLALGPRGLFVAAADKCLQIDPATGQTKATYDLPAMPEPRTAAEREKRKAYGMSNRAWADLSQKMEDQRGLQGRWGYVACEGGRLYGSRSLAGTESVCLFAIDLNSGDVLWNFAASRIPHNSVSVANGRLYLVTGDVTDDERQTLVDRAREAARALPADEQPAALRLAAKADVRAAVALDAASGKLLWRQVLDLTHCGGTNIASMTQDGVLLIFGVYLDGHYWKQFFAGEFAARQITALDAGDGHPLWSQPVGYRVRPVVVGDTLYAEPWAYELHTGKQKTRVNPITGREEAWQFARPGHHCGCPDAAPHCLFFRSYTLGYYDLDRDFGTEHFGAQRPGCWINFIPAGGLLLMPEASTGCLCPFPNVCSVAFQPIRQAKGFGMYSATGPTSPVHRLGLHFGAPGDRLDAAGNLWLGYPRPGGSLVLPLKLDVQLAEGGRYYSGSSRYSPVQGTDDPWLFASGVQGLARLSVPLLAPDDGVALYRVRLALADPECSRPGQRLFDVKLQGQTVLAGCDVAREAGGANRALWKEFAGVEVRDNLVLELVPQGGAADSPPKSILQALEIVQQRVVSIGCRLPQSLSFNAAQLTQSMSLRLANIQPQAVRGTLLVEPPAGFQADPARVPVDLEPGRHVEFSVTVTAAADLKPGEFPMPVRLQRADGRLEIDRQVTLQHQGHVGRAVFKAVADSYASQRYVDLNKGTATVLLVDGGGKQMGDTDHSVAYLRFRVDLPGRPIRATLRLRNAGNPSKSAGQICLVTDPWDELQLNYSNRPAMGRALAKIGVVEANEWVERDLPVDVIPQQGELSVGIDATSTDGVNYVSREGASPPELVIEFGV